MGPARFKLSDQLLVVGDLAGRIDADMGDMGGLRSEFGLVEAEHLIERGDTVCFRRRHLEHFTDMVEAARADPTLGVLQPVESRKQQVAVVTATVDAAIHETLALAHDRRGRPHGSGDSGNLDFVGCVVADKKVSHQRIQLPSRSQVLGCSRGSRLCVRSALPRP